MPTCPVCGYPELTDPPRGASGGGSYEICPSCGFQFGVDDDDKGLTYEQARERWVDGGLKWHSRGKARPKDWEPKAQLAALTSGGKKSPLPEEASASHGHPQSAPLPRPASTSASGEAQETPAPPKAGNGKWWAPWKK